MSVATEFVKAFEKGTGLKIACVEEITVKYRYISKEKLFNDYNGIQSSYYSYL